MGSMSRFSGLLLVALLLAGSQDAWAQNDAVTDARTAMASGDYVRAIAILSASIRTQPTADAYIYLGISYAHTREWMTAENTLKEGASRYPQDPRFHNELAGVYLATNDLIRARQSLEEALSSRSGQQVRDGPSGHCRYVDGKNCVGSQDLEQGRTDPLSATFCITATWDLKTGPSTRHRHFERARH